ncbi:hypothetical protein ACFLZH_04875 [Patescibacteria group bacterium]
MGDTGNIPSLPSTVDLEGGAAPEGDPLELMQKTAREAIDSVNKNAIADDAQKLSFKKSVLKKLKTNVTAFEEIDKKFEAKKAEEAATTEGEAKEEEEDPFADIFGDEGAEQDESTQEKMKIAQGFVSEIKMYKEKFLKDIRIKKEVIQKQSDEKELENLLGKLNNV